MDLRKHVREEGIDFVDFGSQKGGSFRYAMRHYGGTKGVGIDIRPEVVSVAQKEGFNVQVGDATNLDIDDNAVSFSLLFHFLEHLPDFDAVERSIVSAIRISRNKVYIRGPIFDHDEYLRSHGYRPFWSHWKGHTYHLKMSEIEEVLAKYHVKKYTKNLVKKIVDSDDPQLHPLESPIDQFDYDPAIHPPKGKKVVFDRDIHREFEYILHLDQMGPWEKAKQWYSLKKNAPRK